MEEWMCILNRAIGMEVEETDSGVWRERGGGGGGGRGGVIRRTPMMVTNNIINWHPCQYGYIPVCGSLID